MRRWYLFVVVSLAIAPTFAEAKSLYVNNSGSPACSNATSYANNTSSTPWCSLLRATWGNTTRTGSSTRSEGAQAGDTVYVTAGTYQTASFNSRDPVYNPANSGTAGAYITFQAVGTVRLTTTNAPASYPWSTGSPIIGATSGSRYIKWDGFTINQHDINYRYGNGIVQVWENYVTISNCTITGEHLNVVQGDQHNGILAQGTEDGTDLRGLNINNNVIHGFTGASDNSSAITLYWLGDAVIEHNELYNNGSGIHAKSSNGDSASVVIRYNLIYGNDPNGIDVQSHSHWYVYQNVIRDNLRGFKFFPTMYQNNMDKPKHIYVVNNTFDNNTYHVYWDYFNWINNCHFKNNILTNSTWGVFGEDVTPAMMTPSRIHFDYNRYHVFATFGVYQASVAFAFATWQGSTFAYQDGHSVINVDPLYVNPAANDFRLSAGSTARSSAVDLLDLDGDGSTADLVNAGAYLTGSEAIGLALAPEQPTGVTIRR